MLIDGTLLSAQSKQIEGQLRELLTEAHREAGAEFNIESPQTAAADPVREAADPGAA